MTDPTDIHPPIDHERRAPLHFIRTELAARAGLLATGTTTGIALIDAIDPLIRFYALCISAVLATASTAYYVMAFAEKVRAWRKQTREEAE